MAELPLSLIESNDEIVYVAVTEDGQPYDLTGTIVRMYIKPKPQTADTNTNRVSVLGTDTGELVFTDETNGLLTAFVPRSALTNAGFNWYRFDVHKGGTIRTASYGVLNIIDV